MGRPKKEQPKKYTDQEVATIVDNEGLDYAIQHYMSDKAIANPELAKAWRKAKKALDTIEALLPEQELDDYDDYEEPCEEPVTSCTCDNCTEIDEDLKDMEVLDIHEGLKEHFKRNVELNKLEESK